MESNTIEQVEAYIERWPFDRRVNLYGPQKQGVWEIMCGAGQNWGKDGNKNNSASIRTPLAVVSGTFLDAIAYAVSLEGFYRNASGIKIENAGSTASGFVRPYQPSESERIEPQEIPSSELYGQITDYSSRIEKQ